MLAIWVQLVGPQPQEVRVEAFPDPGLLPGPEPAVGGPAGSAVFRRDVLSAGADGEHEPDHLRDDSVGDSGPSPLRTDGLRRRQVMGDEIEESLRHPGTGHGVVS